MNVCFSLHLRRICLVILTLISVSINVYSQQLIRIKHFGKNKGNLKMFVHVPANADKTKPLPLVVVLHGCLQCAAGVEAQTGWSKLGDENNFYVLYPQQRIINNPEKCFKWYKRKQTKKNKGENYSIRQMIEYMKSNYAINSKQVYITGLSAGAAMGVIIMANYPETFNAGAIFAGCAYKAGNGIVTSLMTMFGWRTKSAEKWGSIVRNQNPGYKGEFPRMIIYQGNNDWIVNKKNGVELMKQWTNLHHTMELPAETITGFVNNKDIEQTVFRDANKNDVVVFYKINNLSHALLVDPGNCMQQGGRRGFFSKDKNYFSTLWTAYDFGLIPTPVIAGKTEVNRQEENVVYTVPFNNNCTYEWTFPAHCKVVKNDNGNSIILNWADSPGAINVTETDLSNCKKQYKTLYVHVK